MASWIIDGSTLQQCWLPVEMMPGEPVVSLFENHKLLMTCILRRGGFVVSLPYSKGITGCELRLSSPTAFSRRSLLQCDRRAKGSLRDPVWVHIQHVFCGWLCVLVGATPALWDVGVGLLFLGNSYLPGCVHSLRLTDFSVCLHGWKKKQMMALTLRGESLWLESLFSLNAAVSAAPQPFFLVWKLGLNPEEDGKTSEHEDKYQPWSPNYPV